MPITISHPNYPALQYGPPAYVYKNGGSMFFKWTTVVSCEVGTPDTLTWGIDLLDGDQQIMFTIGPYTVSVPQSGVKYIEHYYRPPSAPPQGGVRPRWTIGAGCAGELIEAACTGVTVTPFRNSTRLTEDRCSI